MGCPYTAIKALIGVIIGVLFISSTFAYPDAELKKKSLPEESKKETTWSTKRVLTTTLVVLFHIDLFTTGYVRAGLEHVMGSA